MWRLHPRVEALGRLAREAVGEPRTARATFRFMLPRGSDVRRDPQLSSVPVVMLTGDRMLSFTSPALDKPFSPVELDALVQRSCSLHRGPGDSALEAEADDRAGGI